MIKLVYQLPYHKRDEQRQHRDVNRESELNRASQANVTPSLQEHMM